MQTVQQTPTVVDSRRLENEVKRMYERVARAPETPFHFELGRALSERLGYPGGKLDRIPASAIESFAGVGYHFDLANLTTGESVLDLGSGSGMDSFFASIEVGPTGLVVGVDMTDAQREKATGLKQSSPEFHNVRFVAAYIEAPPFADESFDCVISNGVINLVADKDRVFREAARMLKPGGRLVLSDIVTSMRLPESVVCDVTLWAACIGGAAHRTDYQQAIYNAGFDIEFVKLNPQYHFVPGRADRSATKYGVSSISVLAVKR